jgi:hypothetical protein
MILNILVIFFNKLHDFTYHLIKKILIYSYYYIQINYIKI